MTTPPSNLGSSNLFKPIKVGSIELKNRLVLAPTGRRRCTRDNIPTDSMLEYYAQRAENNGGLLIVEATSANPILGIKEYVPMLHTEKHVKAFKKLTDAVHQNGSAIALQMWGVGRNGSPKDLKDNGVPYTAPSAIYTNAESEKAAKEAGNELRELSIPEIKELIKEFAEGAKRAINEAGFDFVEIHGAHQYLVDEFLQSVSNKRTDEYGGSIENRARFLFELLDATIDAIGADKVALRLSPYAECAGSEGIYAKINPMVTCGYVLSELERRARNNKRIAYVSVVEPRVSGIFDNPDAANIDFTWLDLIWKGVIVRAGAFLHESNIEKLRDVVNKNDRTLIAAGRFYTSNPDLADRLKRALPLPPYDRSTFYLFCSNVGYLGFGKYGETHDHSRDEIKPQPLA